MYKLCRGSVRSGEVIKRIAKAGWVEVRQNGSHKHFRHQTLPGTVTVRHPKSEIAIGTLRSIERQSGVRLR
ncbi:type II toxin-antitoxin system HicA family toxin [uncultured Sphingomonas sp.]|uniref:type II toxin-antitoxin system HicA family toxin n=1 Tax=uncultured Sphingomonas sp. TaxID=158754 RepID=UPI0035CB170F